MNSRGLLLCAVLVCTLGCQNPFSPSENENDVFTFTVDGQAFRAAGNGRSAFRAGGSGVILNGNDCRNTAVFIQFPSEPAVGTFPLGGSGLSVGYVSNGAQFDADQQRGSGSVTVTTATGNRVAGSFSVQLVPAGGSGNSRAVTGEFNLTYSNRTICG